LSAEDLVFWLEIAKIGTNILKEGQNALE